MHPATANALALVMLTISFGLFLTVVLTLWGLYARRAYINEANHMGILTIALREGAMASLLILGLLWTRHFQALNIWVAVLAVLTAVGLEYFFLSRWARQA